MKKTRNNYFKIFFCIALVNFTFFFSNAQWYNPDNVNKKAKKVYEAAYDLAMQGEYEKSVAKLEDALKIEPDYVEVYLSRAGIFADKKNYQSSINDFQKAFSLDSVFSSTYLLPYSISLAGVGNFEKALEKVNAFLKNKTLNPQSIKSGNYRKRTYEFAINYKKNHPVDDYHFLPKNLGDSINGNALEYYPSLTIDGKKMIFTRRINNDEDFYESDLVNNVWTKSKAVSGKINTNLNEGAQAISQDGKMMVFTGCNYPEGMGSCDLYVSYKTRTGNWTKAENLGPEINTEAWESAPSISPDNKDLYFSSSRSGGYGSRDIWVSHKQPNGKWGKPENMGPAINTDGDDACPFIHADNQTLYFNSNGHMGYGMTDLFLSRKGEDGKWGEPENLGYPINTIDDEGSLIIAADGKTSYYASDRENKKAGLDIYRFELRKDICALKTLWINGSVFDKKTHVGLPSTVILTDINNRSHSTEIQTDEEGNFLITLPVAKDYAFNINRKGYLFYSDNFSLIENSVDSFFNLSIPLQAIEAGSAIILKNIFFDNNQTQIKPVSEDEIDKVIMLLNENPKLTVQIIGHTDNVGKKEDNLALSLSRAKSVVNYIVSRGINAGRLTAKGFGDTKPIASNDNEQGKILNRRTEINVISN